MEKAEAQVSENSLSSDVVRLLRELLHAFLMASVPTWIDLQLTLPQLRTLFITAHEKSSSVMVIARHLGVGKATASHLIEKLVRTGLVDRGEDPADRRRVIVRLSPKGEALIERLLGWEELMGGWLVSVPQSDLSLFRRGLNAIVNEIQNRQKVETIDKPSTNENQEAAIK
ncbi:MAG: MarR family transcriptional regulator [Rectinemataceae bacterium]|jgi:DNA-binding MarR family transcriptional regulator